VLTLEQRSSAPARLAVACAGATAAVVAGALIARAPELALLAAVLGVVLWVLLPRLTLVTAALSACFFYDDFFTEMFGFWNPGKLLGLLAGMSLMLSWLGDRRPLVLPRQTVVIAGLLGSLMISITFARDPSIAVQTCIRYVMFFALFFITVQALRRRSDIDLTIDVSVAAATLAALIGLYNFFVYSYPRVSGPLADAGDFGFLLGATVPLALYRVTASKSSLERGLRIASAVILVAAIIGTFARADILGLCGAGAWALATRRVRLRWAPLALVCAALIGLAAYQVRPELIENSLAQKQNVADRNVEGRFGLWGVAIDEWQESPIFGVGPGQFEVRFPEFKSPFHQTIQTTHNAYLNVLAELGAYGFVLFVLYLGLTWADLRRRHRRPEDDLLGTAIAAGFLVAFIGAFFMTQQFYPPLWFLAALGFATNRVLSRQTAAA
jgi:O-antigen ligase